MGRYEFDQEALDCLNTIDFSKDYFLKVHSSLEERYQAQRTVAQIIKECFDADLTLRVHHDALYQSLSKENLLELWSSKRSLGHVQRCVCSGELSFFEWGIQSLERFTKIVPYAEGIDVEKTIRGIILGEGHNTCMAWTMAPFLLANGKSYDEILRWVAKSRGKLYEITLPGFEYIPIEGPFSFPDRFSLLTLEINPSISPLSQHRNYQPAKVIAKYLIENRFVWYIISPPHLQNDF